MYYNEIIQPDGTHCIGINYEEERPSILEVLSNPEIQQQVRQPDYQIFEFKIVRWLNLFIIISSAYYSLVYDNMISISNCIACVLPLHSVQNNNLYGIIVYTVYKHDTIYVIIPETIRISIIFVFLFLKIFGTAEKKQKH